tara:strand:- start:245 stop:937 length:693 start_codon:yes stop_codon:yes gene_type:complete
MVNIDDVYQKVLVLANKEQRGYITPQEFNLFANQAQREIFEQYFYDLNQFSKIHGDSGEYSDVVHNINEKIAIFERTNSFTGGSFDGNTNELYRLGTVIYNHDTLGSIEVEEVQQNEILYINASPLTRPTLNKPVYVRLNSNTISVFPSSITTVGCTYVQAPIVPKWGYFVVGNKALYDVGSTTDFYLHQSEESELVYKILKLAGITMKSSEVVQVGQTLEQSQVQQEKQ